MEKYKILGVVSILVAVLAGWFMVRTWRGDRSMSLSLHAAAHRQSYLLFASTLTICGIAFYLFQIKWLVSQFHLPFAFNIVATGGFILQLLTAWFPDSNVLERRIHRFCAYSLAATMTVVLGLLAASSHISTLPRTISWLVVLGMVAVWFVYIFAKRLRPYYLVYQSAYIVGFFMAILAVTYIR